MIDKVPLLAGLFYFYRMALPFFYITPADAQTNTIILDEDTSRHVVQVLRMQAGESLHLTDGAGNLLTAVISDAHKKHCSVSVEKREAVIRPGKDNAIGISILKNSNRFEWFLEKATELGIREIIPLLCDRTEKEKFRSDRMQQICISAMLQSKQCWLPDLHEPTAFDAVVKNSVTGQRFIAHCAAGEKKPLAAAIHSNEDHRLLLIGPEGDFTEAEIQHALEAGLGAVSLGDTRLRTETAGVTGAVLLCHI
jgi:16S rRNA (uracil1498-N3)-methyltransferase